MINKESSILNSSAFQLRTSASAELRANHAASDQYESQDDVYRMIDCGVQYRCHAGDNKNLELRRADRKVRPHAKQIDFRGYENKGSAGA